LLQLGQVKNIYIDGLGLVDDHFSGIGQYILGILRGMDKLIEYSKENTGSPLPKVRVVVPRDKVKKFRTFNLSNIEPKVFPMNYRYMSALWHRGKLPFIDLWCGRGTYIFPRFVRMSLAFSKSMLVIYDLSYEFFPEYSEPVNAAFLSKMVPRSIKKSQKIITISQNARNDILSFYRVSPSNVIVATPGVDTELFYRRSPNEIEKVKRRYGITKDYIITLSNLEPRKNLNTLVDVYCNLPAQYRENVSLLIVGVNGWKTDELIQKIISKAEQGYNIIRPNSYVSDEDKPALISGAKMLVYPSHYEGFGMPPLEALACGVPVITANNSSLPEVVGSAGKMVQSNNGKALYKTIKEYLDNIDELTTKAIIEGPKQAQKFSWVESAKVFLEAARNI